MKKCSKCKHIKIFDDFHKNKCQADGHENQCKECKRSSNNKWYNENKDVKQLYYENNREKIIKSAVVRNKEYTKKKYRTDINYRISRRLRSRLCDAIKGKYKTGSAVAELGCSIDEFKAYIEQKFLPGMTWENWGSDTWHLDHIIPLASFNLADKEQLLKACHYTNYQPLWAKDNLRKRDKVAHGVN